MTLGDFNGVQPPIKKRLTLNRTVET
jgi:hypothetical protein